jgi:hypothetical protein
LVAPGSNHAMVVMLSAANVLNAATLRCYAALPMTACGYLLGQTVLVVSTLHRCLATEGQYLIDFDDHRIPLALWVSIQFGLYGSTHDLLA